MFTGTSYFEANHGKGAVDEIEGTVNHAVYSHDNNSMVLGHHREKKRQSKSAEKRQSKFLAHSNFIMLRELSLNQLARFVSL